MKAWHLLATCAVALILGLTFHNWQRRQRLERLVRILEISSDGTNDTRVFGYSENGSNFVLWTEQKAR